MLWMHNNTWKAEFSPYWDYLYSLEGDFVYQIYLN